MFHRKGLGGNKLVLLPPGVGRGDLIGRKAFLGEQDSPERVISRGGGLPRVPSGLRGGEWKGASCSLQFSSWAHDACSVSACERRIVDDLNESKAEKKYLNSCVTLRV